MPGAKVKKKQPRPGERGENPLPRHRAPPPRERAAARDDDHLQRQREPRLRDREIVKIDLLHLCPAGLPEPIRHAPHAPCAAVAEDIAQIRRRALQQRQRGPGEQHGGSRDREAPARAALHPKEEKYRRKKDRHDLYIAGESEEQRNTSPGVRASKAYAAKKSSAVMMGSTFP